MASQLGVELVDEPIETCSQHKPRPILKPSGDGLVGKLLHREELMGTETKHEETVISSNGSLKPSRFRMAEYARICLDHYVP